MQRFESEVNFVPESMNYQFKANPIPKSCSILIFDKKTQDEEKLRLKRIKEMAE